MVWGRPWSRTRRSLLRQIACEQFDCGFNIHSVQAAYGVSSWGSKWLGMWQGLACSVDVATCLWDVDRRRSSKLLSYSALHSAPLHSLTSLAHLPNSLSLCVFALLAFLPVYVAVAVPLCALHSCLLSVPVRLICVSF